MNTGKESAPEGKKQDASPPVPYSLERLILFSDAVFAIAITLLVLEIRLPVGGDSADSRQLLQILGGLWHKYLAYFISFWVIGLNWISHHRKLLYIQRADFQLLSLNLLTLMLIAFTPFPTAVMSENISFTATAFYALMMILVSLSGLTLWWYAAYHHKLIGPELDDRRIRQETLVPAVTVAVFMLSIGVAAVEPGLARIVWVLIFPEALILRRRTA
jgi:uncharacterized membrane protein